jgi:hypothetical protein
VKIKTKKKCIRESDVCKVLKQSRASRKNKTRMSSKENTEVLHQQVVGSRSLNEITLRVVGKVGTACCRDSCSETTARYIQRGTGGRIAARNEPCHPRQCHPDKLRTVAQAIASPGHCAPALGTCQPGP